MPLRALDIRKVTSSLAAGTAPGPGRLPEGISHGLPCVLNPLLNLSIASCKPDASHDL